MTTRRQFLKRGVGAVSLGVMMPNVFLKSASGQSPANRRILVVVEFAGGNDGLNTVIPYTDSQYHAIRPTIGFKDSELKDAQGRSTVISNEFGLHPALGGMKEFYDAGKAAVVLGVGYPNPNGSHFFSADIWHTASLNGKGSGWLGRYAEVAHLGYQGLPAVAIEDKLPKTFYSASVVVPNIPSFDNYGLQTDWEYSENHDKVVNTFLKLHRRDFPYGSFIGEEARIGLEAVTKALEFRASLDGYTTTVDYPNTSLAQGFQMIAQIITALADTNLFYLQIGGFDTHSEQIDSGNKTQGQHAGLLNTFSGAVKAFYDDLALHGLADNALILQWSEFGRTIKENKSIGTDHGTASTVFVIGNGVRGGIYGQQPSLASTALDDAGNPKFTTDFRSVYATVLDKWLNGDSRAVLDGPFENLGFL